MTCVSRAGWCVLLVTASTTAMTIALRPPSTHGPEAVVAPPPGAFAAGVRLVHREENGLAVHLSAAQLEWAPARIHGPIRVGFLRELRARDVDLRISLPASAAISHDAPQVLPLARLGGEEDPPLAAASFRGLRLELRRPDAEPLRLKAKRAEWRAGGNAMSLHEATVRTRDGWVHFPELLWRVPGGELAARGAFYFDHDGRRERRPAGEAGELFPRWISQENGT